MSTARPKRLGVISNVIGWLAIAARQGPSRATGLIRWQDHNGDIALKHDFPLSENSLVIDGGGFHGEWSAQIFKKYRPRILVYEPIPTLAKSIGQLFLDQGKVTVVEAALASKEGKASISLMSEASSLLRSSRDADSLEIQTVDVLEVLQEIRGGPIDLLKLNVEGSEFEILERLIAHEQIGRIRHLVVQFHNIDHTSKNRRRTIRRQLRATHRCKWNYPWVWEAWSLK